MTLGYVMLMLMGVKNVRSLINYSSYLLLMLMAYSSCQVSMNVKPLGKLSPNPPRKFSHSIPLVSPQPWVTIVITVSLCLVMQSVVPHQPHLPPLGAC